MGRGSGYGMSNRGTTSRILRRIRSGKFGQHSSQANRWADQSRKSSAIGQFSAIGPLKAVDTKIKRNRKIKSNQKIKSNRQVASNRPIGAIGQKQAEHFIRNLCRPRHL